MPITTGLTTRSMAQKGKGHIHTDKWHRCIQHVKAKGGGYDPYAVCTFSIGYNESVNPEHQTPGPHSSRDTRRFKRRKERKEKEQKQDISFATVLKYNKCHDDKSGRFESGNCGSGSGSEEDKTSRPIDTQSARQKQMEAVLAYREANRRAAQAAERQGKSGSGKSSRKAPVPLSKHLTPAQKEMQIKLARQDKKPIHKVKTVEEGVALILKGENVELQDTKDVHTILKKLGEMAIEAKKHGKNAPNFDPCTITVKGASLFCGEKIRTKQFPHGIPRIEMPQFKSKHPVPGSEADSLPRLDGEVDATRAFLEHLEQAGVKSNPDGKMLARKLKASQAEMEGAKVAGMMLSKDRDPKKAKITVSSDGYVIDGHHTWAASVGRDAEDGNLDNDKEMEVVIVDMPMSKVYHIATAWTRRFGLPAAGVKKLDFLAALRNR